MAAEEYLMRRATSRFVISIAAGALLVPPAATGDSRGRGGDERGHPDLGV
jgi:hypothetical protein